MTIRQLLQGRFVSIPMLNDTGAALAEGSVCYVSDGQFKLTTTEGLSGKALVVIPDEIPDGEIGRGILVGSAVTVLLESPGNKDDLIITSTTSGKAKAVTTAQEGIFGCLLEDGSAPPAIIWGYPNDVVTHTHERQAIFTSQEVIGTGSLFLRLNNKTNNRVITKIYLEINTAPVGADIIVDVHKDGTTIFTNQANRPKILDGQFSGESVAMDITAWDTGEYLQVEIDQVGSGTPGSWLTVQIIFEEASGS